MKRKLIMGILVIGVLSFAACGSESSSDADTQTNVQTEKEEVKEEKKDTKNKEISMEALRNYEVSPESEFEVRTAEGGIWISEYLGKSEVVVIPEEIEGEKVIEIGKAFTNDSGVKAIRIADNVEILDQSFAQNADLQYVICGSGLKEIGNGTFFKTGLTEIELNEGLEIIGPIAFGNCPNLEVIYIPESVTEIDATAFGMVSEGFTIRGKAGSVAEAYANQKEYNFEAVE